MLKMGSINVNASSAEGESTIAYFNASFSAGGAGGCTISKNIVNMDSYEINKESCEEDYAEFEEKVKDTAARLQSGI